MHKIFACVALCMCQEPNVAWSCVCAGVWFGMVAVSVGGLCKAFKGAGLYALSSYYKQYCVLCGALLPRSGAVKAA